MQNILDTITQFDETVFFYINKTIKSDTLDLLFSWITHLAEPTTIILLCLMLFLFGKYRAKLTSVLILFLSYISFIISKAIKEVINRSRPIDVYSDISVFGTVNSSAFPSSHSVLIAVVITILCSKYKKLSFILIPIALLVGISRIYLGHHFPSDVIAGFILGSVVALLFLGIESLFKNIQNL